MILKIGGLVAYWPHKVCIRLVEQEAARNCLEGHQVGPLSRGQNSVFLSGFVLAAMFMVGSNKFYFIFWHLFCELELPCAKYTVYILNFSFVTSTSTRQV